MKVRTATVLVGLPLLFAPLTLGLTHCGDGKAPHPYNPGGTPTSVPTVTPDGSAPSAFYAPKGCPYGFTPPAGTPFTDFALDDTTAPAAGVGTPIRVRVGLGGGTTKGQPDYADPTTSAAILWETSGATTNAKVRYGTDPSSLTSVQAGYVYTSPPPQVGFGTSDPPGYFHQVDVCGLTPGTTYYYQVGGGASGSEVWSATQSFATVPAAGTKMTVGVFGDARDTLSTWQLVHQRMRGAAPNLMLVSGDIVDLGTEESLFAQWLDAIWKDPSDAGGTGFFTLGQFMMIPIAGNHENDSSQFYGNFAIPGGSGQYAKQFASFDVGNTHFVMVDDQQIAEYATSDAAAADLAWLDSDLKAANADRTAHPFIVVISHRGLFSTSNHATDFDVIQARSTMAPLFDKYHVDLVMNGHDHEYERTKPITAGNPPTG
ncbi:MAG TPA: fibronectin type III domain-containing protein, partial [Polyangiaceae bacterium]